MARSAWPASPIGSAPPSPALSLADLDAALPPDHGHAVAQLEGEVAGAEVAVRQARFAAAQARRELEVASRRRWGQRDNQALHRFRSTLQRSDEAVAAAVEAEHEARRRLEAEVAHQRERTKPPRRSGLSGWS